MPLTVSSMLPTPTTTALAYSLVLVPGTNADAFARQLDDIAALTDGDMYDVMVVDRRLSLLVTRIITGLGGDITIVKGEANLSYAQVCNRIAAQAKGQRLVFIGSDANLYPGWLHYINEAFAADPSLAVVRSADSDAIALSPVTFAGLRGLNEDSLPGHELDDLCVYAATRGERVGFDRNRAAGRSELRWKYLNDGYVRLSEFVDPDTCDRIIAEGEAYYASQGVNPHDVNRVMNFHRVSPTATAHLTGERFNSVLRELFAEDPLFLQTILFYEGSQQDLHSDWIYMSTDRHHRLMGTWLALEDVHDDAGPLRYLPGSNRLTVESIPKRWERLREEIDSKLARGEEPPKIGGRTGWLYDGWEKSIGPAALEAGYKETRFLAKKGDILLWHANLIHGGTKIERPGSTRRSIVAHYLTREISGYYDINYPKDGVARNVEQVEFGAANVAPDLKPKK